MENLNETLEDIQKTICDYAEGSAEEWIWAKQYADDEPVTQETIRCLLDNAEILMRNMIKEIEEWRGK